MRKTYKCRYCNETTDIFPDDPTKDLPLNHCPKCQRRGSETAPESWADVALTTFDEELLNTIESFATEYL